MMQTFLPYPDFRRSVQVLDSRRLGKQRVEAYQILRILLGLQQGRGWRNHPAVLMWREHPEALKLYHNLCIEEWIARGYRNSMAFFPCSDHPPLPAWFGSRKFHRSHKSNLLRKDPTHYSRYFRDVPDDIPYYWPVVAQDNGENRTANR